MVVTFADSCIFNDFSDWLRVKVSSIKNFLQHDNAKIKTANFLTRRDPRRRKYEYMMVIFIMDICSIKSLQFFVLQILPARNVPFLTVHYKLAFR